MTAFVILAAGRGTRIGRVGSALHKALVPLSNKAIISHQINAVQNQVDRFVIVVGHLAAQIEDYVTLAHPGLNVTFVSKHGGGPGAALLACKDVIGDDDMWFTSCDTLWEAQKFPTEYSWSAVAPIPAGTPAARWCQMSTNDNDIVTRIIDKKVTDDHVWAYTGMSFITRDNIQAFWYGLEHSQAYPGELEISRGLTQLVGGQLHSVRINWTDVGDEESYRHAIAATSGFDWIKLGQATYVLPETGRVVKFHENRDIIRHRTLRAESLKNVTAQPVQTSVTGLMIGYPYAPGEVMYDALDSSPYDPSFSTDLLEMFLKYYHTKLFTPYHLDVSSAQDTALAFYRDKTFKRVMSLPDDMRSRALDVITNINWNDLCENPLLGSWHGDLNFGNIIFTAPDDFTLIDWREDYAGVIDYGDMRYDLAKLMAGCVVHWSNAQRGDFRPWDFERTFLGMIREFMRTLGWSPETRYHTEIIAALSLLNCAPLHASPLDEVLVSRGVKWLEKLK